MLTGLHAIHELGFAHRDMKLENILLNQHVIKIGDFGFAKAANGGLLHTRLGTVGYQAPEILYAGDNGLANYNGYEVDLFALGVILFDLRAGSPPFKEARMNDVYYRLIEQNNIDQFWNNHSNHRMPGYFSESFKDLVTAMLRRDPAQRLTIA